jgi:hypothetical protein
MTCASRVQLRRRGAGGGGLGRVLLDLAQLANRADQGHQVRQQRDNDQRRVAGDLSGQGDQPGRGAQLAAVTGGAWDLAVTGTRGAVVTLGRKAQRRLPPAPPTAPAPCSA